jgi:hypothetical protein
VRSVRSPDIAETVVVRFPAGDERANAAPSLTFGTVSVPPHWRYDPSWATVIRQASFQAVPHREQAWLAEVRRALAVLAEAASEEAGNAARPDSLLSDISRTQPWLRNQVRGLRIHYGQLRDGISALGKELDGHAGEAVDFTDVRQRLAWVLAGLRHQRARESDLIYEACRPRRHAASGSAPGR